MKESFNKILESEQPTVVDFYASWCAPCKTQSKILEDLSKEISGKARILKIDIDKNQLIANQFQISSVPTLMIFQNGRPVWRQSGVAQKNQLIQVINQHT